MKKMSVILTVLLLTVAVGAAELEKPIYGNERAARNISIGSQPIFTITPGQADAVEVVIDADALRYTVYAAEELCKYLSLITGTTVKVVNTPSNNVRHHFYLGVSKASIAAGVEPAKLCRDAFYIITRGNDVYIAGRDESNRITDPRHDLEQGGIWGRMYEKGTLFGVYDFLERFADCRFYFPGKLGVIVPEKRPLKVPEIKIFDRPDYEFRRVSIFNGVWEGKGVPYADTITQERALHYDYLRLQTRIVPNNHGLGSLNYAKRFGKSNPEYFALRSNNVRCNDPAMQFPGQLCYSSNIFEEIFKDAKALLSGENAALRGINNAGSKSYWDPSGHQVPTAYRPGIFGFMPQDAYINCTCDKCKKHFVNAQTASNFMWGKLVELNERLSKENLGRYYISLMGYPPYKIPPQVKLPENVLVMLATQGPWDSAEQQKLDLKLIRSWNNILPHKVWLWNYPGKFGVMQMPGVPDITPKSIAGYYKSLRNDISGAYMNSGTDKIVYHNLNYYVFAKVAWNNDLDTEALLNDYYQNMYGKAAPYMKKIVEKIEELWIKQIGGKCTFTELGPISTPPSENEVWFNVYNKKTLAELAALFEQAEKSVSGIQLERVRFMRKEIMDELEKRHREYMEKNNAVAAFTYYLAPEGVNFNLQPFRNVSKSLKSKVNVKKSANELIVTFDCEEPEMAKVKAVKRSANDLNIWQDNGVELFVDPTGKRQSYYQILINSLGSVCSRKVDAGTRQGSICDLGVKVDTAANARDWSVVIRIPLNKLEPWNNKAAAFNFVRVRCVGAVQELYTWSPFLKYDFQEVENFGTLTCEETSPVKNIVPEGSFEVRRINPHLLGNWVVAGPRDAGNTVELDENIFVDGSKSLCMTSRNKEFNSYFGIRYYLPELKENTRYRLSFYLRTENVVPLRSGGGGANLNIWDTANRWFPVIRINGTHPWRFMSFNITTPAGFKAPGKQRPYIACCLYFATGKVWFDNVVLQKLPAEK